jgi:hypothetical protein
MTKREIENKQRIVIEESKRERWNEFPGMLLSPTRDLSHTSILYYRVDMIGHKNFLNRLSKKCQSMNESTFVNLYRQGDKRKETAGDSTKS